MKFLPINIGLILIFLLIIIILLWGISIYNKLIHQREFVRNSMGQVSAQIESRWDALQNMISGTKQYAEYEANTLASITEQRASLGQSASVTEVAQDDQLFSQALGRLVAIAESYPDLKASQVYQETLQNVDRYENQVRQSRMIYNDTVTKYNRSIQSIPSNIIASLFNFTQKGYFENADSKANMPSWD